MSILSNPTFILFAVLGLIGLAVWIFSKMGVIDEDSKYLIFDKDDKDKMDPAEFKKAMEVNKQQEETRKAVLKRKGKK